MNGVYRHAVVCIDLRSMEAAQLLSQAESLVSSDGRLCAVTVIEVGSLDPERDAVASLVEEEYYSRNAHLARLCAEAGHPGAEARVLVGKPAAEIAAFASRTGCDVLVLGNHTSGRDRARLGSTAAAILALLDCDALVVYTRHDVGAGVDIEAHGPSGNISGVR